MDKEIEDAKTPSLEHLIRARIEMEYLRRDFSKHETHDDTRFNAIKAKLDSNEEKIDKASKFQIFVTGGCVVGLAILQIYLKFIPV